jgi:heat shock protein HslJ
MNLRITIPGTAMLARMTALGVMSLLVLTSCEDAVTNPSDLGGQWRLEVLRGPDGSQVTPPDPSRFTVEFAADGQILVRADCNGCGGRYTLDDDTVVVSTLACTLIACPNAPLDARFLAILDGASSFDFEDGRLVISSSRGTLRFNR